MIQLYRRIVHRLMSLINSVLYKVKKLSKNHFILCLVVCEITNMILTKVFILISLGLLASSFITSVASDPFAANLPDAFKLHPRGLLKEEDLEKAQKFLDKTPGVKKLLDDNGINITDFIKVPADVVVKTSDDVQAIPAAAAHAVEIPDEHDKKKKKRGGKKAERA